MFYFRDRGYMFAEAVHNIVASNWNAPGGDAATIVDNPSSPLHPDGRVDGWNYGGQSQDIYTTGIDAGRMRISASGNPNDLPVGGIRIGQPPPITEPPDDVTDGFLGYRFDILIGSPQERVIGMDAPLAGIFRYSVYDTPSSVGFTELIGEYDGTDGASVRIIPSPGPVVVVLFAFTLAPRRPVHSSPAWTFRRGKSH